MKYDLVNGHKLNVSCQAPALVIPRLHGDKKIKMLCLLQL